MASGLGLNPRFVLEWLRAATAGNVIEYAGDDRFFASPEVDLLLAEPEKLASLQSLFVHLPSRLRLWGEVPGAFRTGIGFDWDSRGAEAIQWMEAGFRNWYEQILVPRALPGGLTRERLNEGISSQCWLRRRDARGNCRAFPASRFPRLHVRKRSHAP